MRKKYNTINGYPQPGMGYIYGLADPETRELRYIGQTKAHPFRRLSYHMNNAKSLPHYQKTPVGKWLKTLIDEDKTPTVLMGEYAPIKRLDELEIFHIRLAREKYNLLNVEAGGKTGRVPGFKMPKEFCERQSITRGGFNNQNFRDLSGKQFNKLTVLKFECFKNQSSWWKCQCECGTIKYISAQRLNKIKSCGCARRTRWTEEERKKYAEYYKNNKQIDEVTKQFVARAK